MIGDEALFSAYRQYSNGVDIAGNRVEAGHHIGATAAQVDQLALASARLRHLFKISGREVYYYLLADELVRPIHGQSQRDFDIMRRELDRLIASIKDAGGRVLRSPAEVQEFGALLDEKLPRRP